jgi:hypothetical protein
MLTTTFEVFCKKIDQVYQQKHGSTWRSLIDAMDLTIIKRQEIVCMAHKICVACHATGQSTQDAVELVETFIARCQKGQTPKSSAGLLAKFLSNC